MKINAIGLPPSMGARRLFSGGREAKFALKMRKNILFSFKKVNKHTILAGQVAGTEKGSRRP